MDMVGKSSLNESGYWAQQLEPGTLDPQTGWGNVTYGRGDLVMEEEFPGEQPSVWRDLVDEIPWPLPFGTSRRILPGGVIGNALAAALQVGGSSSPDVQQYYEEKGQSPGGNVERMIEQLASPPKMRQR
jgi:hypothetical protein